MARCSGRGAWKSLNCFKQSHTGLGVLTQVKGPEGAGQNLNQVKAEGEGPAQPAAMHRQPGNDMRHPLPLVIALTGAFAAQAQTATSLPPSALPQVVVSATRHAIALADAPAAITVLNAEAVAERGSDNLLALLRTEPSVSSFGRPIGGRKALSLRGMDPRHTLILVDGQRINASDGLVGSSDFQLDWTGAVDIARVEVVRGPMSVLYGAEALGGVVNVITQPLPEAWEGRALLEGREGEGGGSGHRAAVALRGGLAQDWRVGLSVSDGRREATPTQADPRITAVEGRHAKEAALRLSWLPALGHELTLDARHSDEDRWLDARERSGLRRYHQSLHDLSRRQLGLGWTANWEGERGLETLLRAYRSGLDVHNQKTNGVASLRPNTLRDGVVEGQAGWRVGASHRVTTGFEWRDEQLDNAGLPGGQAQATHRAAYLQDEWQANTTLAITGGLRADHHARFGSELSPRAYAVWKLGADWTLKGGVGHGFKAPTLKQIDPAYREDEGPNTYVGRADLRPEVNDSAELGLAWDAAHWGASAMLFRNRVAHLIVPKLISGTAARGVYEFRNIDQARLQGLETQLGWRQGAWSLQANATWLSARDGQGVWLEKRAARTLGLRADVRGEAGSLGVALEHQGGLRLASAVVGQPPQAVRSLTFVHLHAKVPVTAHMAVRLGLDNATNLRLAERSPLFSYEDLPRTLRLTLEGRW
ncbi:TonB-dependent receptor [Inhella crocodyli]|uniref:TonB-dependent receptor n=2 Tax=Inhella crocodyli TaxID=2499851 RepID=A0A437LTG7_9BURK|nr:TonB-dependent receptor [Inhella crocodyli]